MEGSVGKMEQVVLMADYVAVANTSELAGTLTPSHEHRTVLS